MEESIRYTDVQSRSYLAIHYDSTLPRCGLEGPKRSERCWYKAW
jgi:hypothetical protein